MRFSKWIRKVPLIGGIWGISDEELDALKNEFKSRYDAFKRLIAENQKALNLMTEIESALMGDAPFDMSYVRSRCTQVSESILEIIEQLEMIAPGKYGALYTRFDDIARNFEGLLGTKSKTKGGALTRRIEKLDRSLADQTGSKMATLGELGSRLGLKIPPGFVITAQAYRHFMEFNNIQSEIDRLIESGAKDSVEQLYDLSEGIRQFIVGCPIPDELKEAIETEYAELENRNGKNRSFAMRSSALGEDGPDMSFAGQYRTVFNVKREDLFLAYKEVIASKYQIQAMMYRLNRGIRDEDVAMCVGCMPFVNSQSGGVVYTGNPLDRDDDNIVILSVWGHPKPVVDGREATDLFLVSRSDPMRIVKKVIPKKKHEFVYNEEEGIYPVDLQAAKRESASLTDERVLELARTVLKIEAFYGYAQDVEWVLTKSGTLHILQSRPLKQETRRLTTEVEIDENLKDSLILDGGITASPGVAAGPVFIVRSKRDSLSFPDGGVLVAQQSLPHLAMLLNRAAAVLTEQGSVAGHLANVAREFNVPAIFGMDQAASKLVNQQLITVDADLKRVFKERQETLLSRTQKKKIEVMGSPTYEALKGASEYIVPLRLLNPDSADFSPENCTTLHDITRFCHEKSVLEMFDNRMDQRLKKHSSKQLYVEVPMQYWVVDLEDGLKAGSENEKYADLKSIESVPMLALWRGMNKIPWDGPPAPDAGGLTSVFMGSTTDPSLNPDMPSAYSGRSYFMISRSFCSLQVRIGYHYATVETLVGRNPDENYARFQFTGGAADLKRKSARANLIGDVLEQKQFHVAVHSDSVTAKIENFEQSFMESRLEMLGYLIIHTRQLDVAMGRQSSIDKYKKKILDDLDGILGDSVEHP